MKSRVCFIAACVLAFSALLAPTSGFGYAIESGQYFSDWVDLYYTNGYWVFYAYTNETIIVRVANANDPDNNEVPELFLTLPPDGAGATVAASTNPLFQPFSREVVYLTTTNRGWFGLRVQLPEVNNLGSLDVLDYNVSMLRIPAAPLSYDDPDVGPLQNGRPAVGRIDVGADLDAGFIAVTNSPTTIHVRMGQKEVPLVCNIDLYDPYGTRLTNDFPPEYRAEITVTVTNLGIYTVVCKEKWSSPGQYALTMVKVPGPLSQGDIDVGMMSGSPKKGTINEPGDVDLAMFAVVTGDVVRISMAEFSEDDSALNPRIHLYNDQGGLLGTGIDPFQECAVITNTCTNSGLFFVVIKDAEDRHGLSYLFNVEILSGPSLSNRPSMVSWLQAGDGTSTAGVDLVWTAATNAIGYEILRNTFDATNTAVKIGESTTTNYTDSTATPGTLYYYWVKAFTSFFASDPSPSDSGWRSLAAPSSVWASDGLYPDRVDVRWTSVTGASGYAVFRGITNDSALSTNITQTAGTNHSDYGAACGVLYYYWVRPVCPLGMGGFSGLDAGWRAFQPPSALSASDGLYSNRIAVAWNPVEGAIGYDLYRNTIDDSGSAGLIATTNATVFNDTNAVPGTLYYYWARSRYAFGSSGFSPSDSGWRLLSPPTGLDASDGLYSDRIEVAWDIALGATSYVLYRNTLPDAASAEMLIETPMTGYSDMSASAGVLYYYWVQSKNWLGSSGLSATNSGWRALAPPPSGINASDGAYSDKISVSWNAVSGATSYDVYRGIDSNPLNSTNIAEVGTPSYDDTSATPGVVYYFWVRARCALGPSGFSASDTGWRALTPPSGVSATDGTYSDRIRIAWNTVAGAAGYEVWRFTNSTATSAVFVASSAGNSYDDTTPQMGRLYYYWVKSVCAAGASPVSNPDSGWRALVAPSGLTASDGTYSNMVHVAWTAVSGASGYQVLRGASPDPALASNLATTVTASYDDETASPGALYYYWASALCSLGGSPLGNSNSGWRALSPPAAVSAGDGVSADHVPIVWNSAVGAASYDVYRSQADDPATAALIANTTATNLDDSTAAAVVQYYYWIAARNSLGVSGRGHSEGGWRSPPAPTGLSASDGAYVDRITVTWNASPGATGYQVWRGAGPGAATAVNIGETSGASFDDLSAPGGVLNYYWVRPGCALGFGTFGGYDTGWRALNAPTDVTASDGRYFDKVLVSWNVVESAAGYRIWRGRTSDPAGAVPIGGTGGATFNDTTALRCIAYYYWVQATNAVSEGALSTPDEGWRLGLPSGYDADGISDLAVFDQASGQWYIRTLDGTLLAWAVPWGWPGATPVPGDYNNDRVSDLAVFDSATGHWYIRALDGTVLAWAVPWGWRGAVPVSGDFNADGFSDLAVFDTSTGDWYIRTISGAIIGWDVGWGWRGATPVPGDYNGDGASDLAVVDLSTGTWYIRSALGGPIATVVTWCWPGYMPVSGDYNGDGLSDLAMYDTTTGRWYIRSIAGPVIVWDAQWGWRGAIPVPGDYDGDSVCDMAVFDPVTGRWYIQSVSGPIIAWGIPWGWSATQPVPGAAW